MISCNDIKIVYRICITTDSFAFHTLDISDVIVLEYDSIVNDIVIGIDVSYDDVTSV